MHEKDEHLWESWRRRRNPDSAAELVVRHSGLVYSTCRRILQSPADAEDVSQECFVELFQSREPVRESLAAWLHGLAVRRSLDWLKQAGRRRRREQAAAARRQTASPGGKLDVPERDELLAAVDEAIALLPEKLRAPLVARFLQGASYREVASRIGLSESASRARVEKALSALRKTLRQRGVQIGAAGLVSFLPVLRSERPPEDVTAALGRWILAEAARLPTVASRALAASRPARALGPRGLAWVAAILAAGGAAAWNLLPSGPEPRVEPDAPAGAAPVAAAPVAAVARQGPQPPSPANALGEISPPATPQWEVVCLTPGGGAVPGADVEAVAWWLPEPDDAGVRSPMLTGRTDSSGIASFAAPFPAGDGVVLRAIARRPGELAGWVGPVPVAQGEPVRIEVPLFPSAALAGTVGIPPGHDPAGVTLRLERLTLPVDPLDPFGPAHHLEPFRDGMPPSWGDAFTVRAARDGSFAFAGIAGHASVFLRAEADGLGRRERQLTKWTEPVELVLLEEAVIEGQVLYAGTGQPAAGVELDAGTATARSDANGWFVFRGLHEGTYLLRRPEHDPAGAWVLRPVLVSTRAGSVAALELVLERGTLVSGTVSDGSTGAPLEAGISIVLRDGEGTMGVAYVATADDGSYETRLAPGSYRLSVAMRPDGYAGRTGEPFVEIEIAPGELERSGVDLVLTRGAPSSRQDTADCASHVAVRERPAEARIDTALELHARVTDPEGSPIPAASVSAAARPAVPGAPRRVLTLGSIESDLDGRFRLGDLLLEDTLSISLSKAGYASRTWWEIPSLAGEVELVLYPKEDGPEPETTAPATPDHLIGKAAPAWKLELWVQPPPARFDGGPPPGTPSIAVLCGIGYDASALARELRAAQAICGSRGYEVFAILPPLCHRVGVELWLAEHEVETAVAIDHPGGGRAIHGGVTARRYALPRGRSRAYRIDASGVVRAVEPLGRWEALLAE